MLLGTFYVWTMSPVGFRIFSLLSTNLKCERSIPLYLKNTRLNFSLYSRVALFQTLHKIKFTACIKLNTILSQRYCSSNPDQNDKKNKSTPLMKFNPVLKPEIMLTIKNWILTKIIIQPYLDGHFTMKDFTLGAKQVIILWNPTWFQLQLNDFVDRRTLRVRAEKLWWS